MQNVVCWDAAKVREVINPFAEHIPDALFRSVHTDWDLKVSQPVGTSFQELTASSYDDVSPVDFLKDFLRADRPHALAVVLGTTGSGKSHLVHWMRLNMPKDDKRLVLVVRKSGTNLRAIIEMIIGQLPATDRQGFLDTLNRAGDSTATRDGQKERLLNELAQAIREDLPRDQASEIESALIEHLPDIFQDPHMRAAHFLNEGTVIADLVDHLFAPSTASHRPDARRVFDIEDLPLGGKDFVNASKNARDAIWVMELDRAQNLPLAIDIINRNLDKATARTLSFSGDRLEELMGRLRTYLKKQGRELVLLVEEFARLQGIDRALLQAITHHGDEAFCKMRSAIAVTTGFFETVAETAYMRTTHVVDMDRSAGHLHGQLATPATLAKFSARYLNAVRLGRHEIDRWDADAQAGDLPPSVCDRCPQRRSCHHIFGHVDGFGLYPFTATALWNAAKRTDHGLPEKLNPRIVQNEVLVRVLDNYAPAIANRAFPPHRLLEQLGGEMQLDLQSTDKLQRFLPEEHGRVTAFLELYDGTGRLVNLPEPLRNAFGIPLIPDVEVGEEPIHIEPSGGGGERPKAVNPNTVALEKWARGDDLGQNIANELRPIIYQAIADSIDWDTLGLERTYFTAATGARAFRQLSIVFARQTTTVPAHVQVRVDIPGKDGNAVRTALALQGLLKASKQQFQWSFAGGGEMLAAFLDCLKLWVADVEQQLKALRKGRAGWDPLAAAFELLSVGAALGGKVKADATGADLIDAALANWPSEFSGESADLRKIYDRICRERVKLVDLARAHISGTKGGQVGAMIDPRQADRTVRRLRKKGWRLSQQAPDEERGEYAFVAKLHRDVSATLESATVAERAARLEWVGRMDAAFGVTAQRAVIVAALEELRDLAVQNGIAVRNVPSLNEALRTFGVVQFDDAVAAARQLQGEGDALSHLPQYGRGRRAAVQAGNDLSARAETFVTELDQSMAMMSQEFTERHKGLQENVAVIDGALASIGSSLNFLEAGAGSANNAD